MKVSTNALNCKLDDHTPVCTKYCVQSEAQYKREQSEMVTPTDPLFISWLVLCIQSDRLVSIAHVVVVDSKELFVHIHEGRTRIKDPTRIIPTSFMWLRSRPQGKAGTNRQL